MTETLTEETQEIKNEANAEARGEVNETPEPGTSADAPAD